MTIPSRWERKSERAGEKLKKKKKKDWSSCLLFTVYFTLACHSPLEYYTQLIKSHRTRIRYIIYYQRERKRMTNMDLESESRDRLLSPLLELIPIRSIFYLMAITEECFIDSHETGWKLINFPYLYVIKERRVESRWNISRWYSFLNSLANFNFFIFIFFYPV